MSEINGAKPRLAGRDDKPSHAEPRVISAGAASRRDDSAKPNGGGRSEEMLLRAMAEGDASAFDELFAKHSGEVLSFLSRLTASRCDPEDLLQETFLRVLTHARDFRPGAAFRPWLFAIARNVAYNTLQKRKLRAEVEVQTDFAADGIPPVAHGAESRAGADPSSRMQLQEQKAKLLAALEELPDAQREIIVLIVFNGFSYEEAAAIIGDSEGTLRSRVFHGLKKLRDRLKELA